MHYILRMVLHEQYWERQIEDLLRLASSTPIHEVMLMEQSHQIVMVPYTEEKHRRMANLYCKVAERLRKNGIEFSINFATTVGHADAAVPEDMVLPFQKFVGEDLKPCHAVCCIADERWADYTAHICSLYANSKPKRFMIDDDFRSLNHSTPYGCFCELHAKLVSKKIGQSISPEELVKAVCEKGKAAKRIKSAWQQVNFQAQLDAAAKIEKAIHSVSPDTQIGLMNSGEPAHSVQGRKMDALLKTFAGGTTALSRPAGGAYSDGVHQTIVEMHQMSALSYSEVKGDTYWVSEVENWPHTRYTKSLAQTKLQLYLHTLWGADALSLNIYDYLATPFSLEPGFSELLKNELPRLEKLAQERKEKHLRGVALPWSTQTSREMENRLGRVEGILPRRPLDNLLPLLGIPTQFETGDINVLLGDSTECYTDDEVKAFLKKALLLDNVAARNLAARGFSEEIGLKSATEFLHPCVEKMTDSELSGKYADCLLSTNWFRLPAQGEWMDRLIGQEGIREVSTLEDPDGNRIGPACYLYQNRQGGRVCVFSQPVQEIGWLHRGRSIQLQNIFKWLCPQKSFPMVYDSPNIAPFFYCDENEKGLLALVNCGLDAQEVELPAEWNYTELFSEDSITKVSLEPMDVVFMKVEA